MSAAAFAHAGAAYRGLVGEVHRFGAEVPPVEAESSPSAGATTHELYAHQFVVLDPRSRLVRSAARPLNVAFPFGAFVHLLAGRDDVRSMAYYNANASKFSDDGRRLGGAYGPRIQDEIWKAVDVLRADPSSRRVVLSIFDSSLDLGSPSRDVPCPLYVQFLGRGGRLHAIATFRSQNAVMLFPYDFALFSLLHEFVAVQSGLEVGCYYQTTGSLHYYGAGARLDERPLAEAVCREPVVAPYKMPPMERLTNDQLRRFFEYEIIVRETDKLDFEPRAAVADLPPWWRGLANLLWSFRLAREAGHDALRDYSTYVGTFGAEQ